MSEEEKAQVEFLTLMMAAFHLGELFRGLRDVTCCLADMAH